MATALSVNYILEKLQNYATMKHTKHMKTYSTLIEQNKNGIETLSIIKKALDKLTPKPFLKKKKLDIGKIRIDIKFESNDLLSRFFDEIRMNSINLDFE